MVLEDISVAASSSVLRTFLTADVRGYTRFTQEFGDEAAARLATKFAALSRAVVAEFGGQVVDLRGDEVMCVFTSARQAFRSAVALQKRFALETEAEPDLPLRVGIGLDAGEVVPVEDGFRGGALNLAARLSSLAAAGEVLASDLATQLARRTRGLAYVERGLVDLKGFADPVRIVRVVDEQEVSPEFLDADLSGRNGDTDGHAHVHSEGSLPIGGFLGALPEGVLVARDEEFDQILKAIQLVERCQGRLVLLSGEPGVGKTRLAQEVTLKARNHSFLIASGRCYEPESSVPFYPFLEALATLYDLAPESIRKVLPDRWPDIQRLLPSQLPSHGMALSEGQEEQQRLFWAVTGFLQSMSMERPLALLLDDLHWADASSLELLQHLARHTRANRILLLGTYRDVEVHRQHPLESALTDLGRERLVDEVEVRRLTESGTGLLVAATLGGDDVAPELVRLVHKHTEGNPFFVEEVARTLVDRGDVYRRDGRWEGRSIEIEVPKSVRSVVGQRLARLAPISQEVLREASVLGPAFTFGDLELMCERAEAELEAAIEESLASGLLRETGRDTYGFNHSLTQGTLYSELSSRKRRRLHLAAGKALEQIPEPARNQRIPELAWHFLEADDPEPALRWGMRAGQAAKDVFAYDEAERHYRTALELARELKNHKAEVRAFEELGRVLRTVARYDEALESFETAVELHRAAGNVAGERWATAHMGRVHALRGTAEQGIRRLSDLVVQIESSNGTVAAESEGSTAGLAALYTALADLYQATGRSEAQLGAAEKALEVARLTQDAKAGARIQVEGQMWRASALAELGELNDARRMLEDVIPLAESTGDSLILSRALNSLATIYSEAGQYDRERDYIDRALQAAEKSGDPTRMGFMHHRLGWYLLMRGFFDDAEACFERAINIWRPLGWTRLAPWTLVGLATIAIARGEDSRADQILNEAEDLTKRRGREDLVIPLLYLTLDRFIRKGDAASALKYAESIEKWPGSEDHSDSEPDSLIAYLMPARAWIELQRGNLDAARDLADQATELASADQNRTILVDSLRMQGILFADEGLTEEARRAFDESITTARTIEQPYAEGRSLEAMAQSLLTPDDQERAQVLGQAEAIFTRIGATADANRVVDRAATPVAAGVSG